MPRPPRRRGYRSDVTTLHHGFPLARVQIHRAERLCAESNRPHAAGRPPLPWSPPLGPPALWSCGGSRLLAKRISSNLDPGGERPRSEPTLPPCSRGWINALGVDRSLPIPLQRPSRRAPQGSTSNSPEGVAPPCPGRWPRSWRLTLDPRSVPAASARRWTSSHGISRDRSDPADLATFAQDLMPNSAHRLPPPPPHPAVVRVRSIARTLRIREAVLHGPARAHAPARTRDRLWVGAIGEPLRRLFQFSVRLRMSSGAAPRVSPPTLGD